MSTWPARDPFVSWGGARGYAELRTASHVFEFQIAVDHRIAVEVLDRRRDLCQVKASALCRDTRSSEQAERQPGARERLRTGRRHLLHPDGGMCQSWRREAHARTNVQRHMTAKAANCTKCNTKIQKKHPQHFRNTVQN